MTRVSSIPYSIRRSERASRARIHVSAEGVEVVVPQRLHVRHVEPFVEEKRAWIERTLRKMREAEQEFAPAELFHGGGVPYLGERLTLDVRVEPGRVRAHVARRGQTLEARVPDAGPETLREALERWYRRRARVEIGPRLDAAALRAGRRHARAADPRPAQPLGQLLVKGGDELQLAAAACAV